MAEWHRYYRGQWHIYGHIHNRREETYEIMRKKDHALNAAACINNYTQISFRRTRLAKSLGTLGGGNHFIEVDEAADGTKYLVIHSGSRNLRERMAKIILQRTGLSSRESFHTVHNYIDTNERIIRKGAISAREGEKLLIPINMRDGSILAKGKGNPEWNYSAPHGAGRIISRKKALSTLNIKTYKEAMKGIYTTSVNKNTLDEAPMAYKSLDEIIGAIRESVDIIEVLKPIYNFKAGE